MFMCLSLLVTTLCFCESLTSIEIFDDFDDTLDLERPAVETFIRKLGDYVTEREKATACVGTSCPERSNYIDEHINSNMTEKLYTDATVTDTNIILNNDTADKMTNGEHQNQLNNTKYEALNATSHYRANASVHTDKNATLPVLTITSAPFLCPEVEQPTNIGPYEVPTQTDVVLHIRNHLKAMYHGFHTKAMRLLKDVKEATQASWSRKIFCREPTELMHYRRCVRWVGNMSVATTKSVVTALETARHHINTLIKGKICNTTALSVDPIHLIRILAAEKVSLEFALPDFLRQLNDCARHCPRFNPQDYLKTGHLTDKDFVIRHYLTQQNFNQQLQQQYKI